jgi:HCOMODA/2-hydroxy-3-carboxy-muconic semialdehyde decarboxylase
VSVRNPKNPNAYFVAAGVAPGSVTRGDVIQRDITKGGPDTVGLAIHDEIYKARPDVTAIIYARTPEITAFTTGSVMLRPVVNGGALIGDGLSVFNMPALDGPGIAAARGACCDGFVLTGGSIYNLVDQAYQLRQNAMIQRQIIGLRGRVGYLNGRRIPRRLAAAGVMATRGSRRDGPNRPKDAPESAGARPPRLNNRPSTASRKSSERPPRAPTSPFAWRDVEVLSRSQCWFCRIQKGRVRPKRERCFLRSFRPDLLPGSRFSSALRRARCGPWRWVLASPARQLFPNFLRRSFNEFPITPTNCIRALRKRHVIHRRKRVMVIREGTYRQPHIVVEASFLSAIPLARLIRPSVLGFPPTAAAPQFAASDPRTFRVFLAQHRNVPWSLDLP